MCLIQWIKGFIWYTLDRPDKLDWKNKRTNSPCQKENSIKTCKKLSYEPKDQIQYNLESFLRNSLVRIRTKIIVHDTKTLM